MTENHAIACATCQRQLEALLDDSLGAAQAALVVAHLEDCSNCGEHWARLVAAMRSPGNRNDFAGTTLAALELDPCAQVEEQSADFIGNALPPAALALVNAHLETCGNCAALLGALALLDRQLPPLARKTVPAGFAQRVLAACAHYGRHEARRNWLQRLLLRPRFAAEAAYCGALLCSLLFAMAEPAPLLHELAGSRTAVLAQSGELLEQGSVFGRQQLRTAQDGLKSLYEQGTDRVEQAMDRLKPVYAELFR